MLTRRLATKIRRCLVLEGEFGTFGWDTRQTAKDALKPFDKGRYQLTIDFFEKLTIAMGSNPSSKIDDIRFSELPDIIRELRAQTNTA